MHKPTNNYPEVTETVLTGGGLFDELMRTVKANLLEEFQQQRIRGSDYAKVYIGSMEAVLTNTTGYLLGKQLLEEQRAKLVAETSFTAAQEHRLTELLPLEKEQHQLEVDKLDLEKERFQFERDFLWELEKEKFEAERDHLEAQAILTKAQADKITAERALIQPQINKINAEVIHLTKQNEMVDKQIEKLEKELEIVEKQIEKIEAEVELINAKTASEKLNAGPNGLIAKQMELLNAQIAGFTNDHNAKIEKVKADVYAVSRSTNPEDVTAVVPSFTFPTAAAVKPVVVAPPGTVPPIGGGGTIPLPSPDDHLKKV